MPKTNPISKPVPPDETDIPPAPPEPLRGTYLKTSWAYVYWCCGMLAWSLFCVTYFIMTRQTTNMMIGIALGVLLIAMIVLPAMLFGGKTWYKRLGWMMLLLGLFTAMWIYPIIMVAIGVVQRSRQGRYRWPMFSTDIWHAAISGLTIIMTAWTVLVTLRTAKLVRQLAKGEFGVTEIKIRH